MAEHLGIQYIYEDEHAETPEQPKLVAKDLAVMPRSWIAELHQASSFCNPEAVKQLQQIPLEYVQLFKRLEHLSRDFLFDQIIALTKPYMA